MEDGIVSEEIKKIITLGDIFDNIETEEKAFKFKDYIKDLQQKVEQLEKENIKQKEIIENLTTMTVCGDKKQIKNTAQCKLEQLENIRKEAIKFILQNCEIIRHEKENIDEVGRVNGAELLNILNKGE
jgi:hypothetical protein